MNSIKAVYKIPSIKEVFFIISSEITFDRSISKELYKKILNEISLIEVPPQWSHKLISENDFHCFLDLIKSLHKTSLEEDFQTNHTSQELEFLSMNILKNQEKDIEFPHDTAKTLCCIDKEDTIEVFI